MLKKRNIVTILALFVALLLTSCAVLNKNLTKLEAPEITLNDNIISWNVVNDAKSYTLYINGTTEINFKNTETQYKLEITKDGIYKIKMKAIGDHKTYANSDYSNIITYNYHANVDTKLDTPVISISKNTIIWETINNATEYKIYVDEALISTISTSYFTLVGYDDDIEHTIKVIASCQPSYIDSDFSNEVVYNSLQKLMKISEIKELVDALQSEVDVAFVGKVMGFDANGYAHVADETGYIYIRHICRELTLGQKVKIEGKVYIYRGSYNYPEYTRQISSTNIKVSIYDGTIDNVIEPVEITSKDLENTSVTSSFHGNPVTITGTVECGSTRYTFYLNDDTGKHLVSIHHYSSNFNNDIIDPSENIFLTLNNKKVTLTGVIYRYYEAENIWTLQCIGLTNEVKILSERIEAPVISIVDNQLVWTKLLYHGDYDIIVNGNYYTTTQNTYFDLSKLEDGSYKLQVKANSNNENYDDSIYSNIIVYTKNATINEINIFMINDTHGSFVDGDTPGVERLSSLIKYLTEENGDYIKIANGDIFQGSYVSSILYGLPFIDALNQMNFDAFVIGNHEFDWGLDKIHAYKDGDYSNGEADFPFLGANIYDKKTNERVSWLDPYTIVEINGLKLGIIGIIGYDLESSILYDNVKDYDFVYPLEIIKQYAKELRTELDCDAVIVSNHDYDTELNKEIAKLTGDMRIDGILCGHTHQNEYDILTRSDSVNIVVVENQDKNQSATSLTLLLNKSLDYESYKFERYYPSNYDLDKEMHSVISKYQSVIDESTRQIGFTEHYLSRQTLGIYAVTSMKEKFNVDVAIMNTGGVRATIANGEITVANVFEVFPFNNMIITTTMKGSALKSLYNQNSDYLYFNTDFNVTNLQNNKDYSVAVIDYVYAATRYSEFKNTARKDTNILLRDLVIDYIEKLYY